MKDQRKSEIRVGITVLLGLIIIIWVFGWAKNINVNAQRKELTVKFSSVAGLEIGDPVTINGVRKGFVDDMKIEKNNVLVKINIDSDIELKEDAKFHIMMLDLMGGKKVEVDPGASENDLNLSLIQNGLFLGDVASAMAVFGSVEKDLVDVIREVKITLSSLNTTLTDSQFNNDLKLSLANLTKLTENLNILISENRSEINSLLNSGIELTESLNKFIETNKDSLSSTISSLKNTLDDSRILISKVNKLIDETNSSRNNIGRLINDTTLVDDLKSSLTNLKELTRLLLEQLQKEGIKVDANIDLF
ncbi:MAG TPA: MlaD family protein [Melioribacteraceae bacterium]|mgnify:CR=1 FL=1|nr:MlaD family protein [Melioribacteraceae bacterium]